MISSVVRCGTVEHFENINFTCSVYVVLGRSWNLVGRRTQSPGKLILTFYILDVDPFLKNGKQIMQPHVVFSRVVICLKVSKTWRLIVFQSFANRSWDLVGRSTPSPSKCSNLLEDGLRLPATSRTFASLGS